MCVCARVGVLCVCEGEGVFVRVSVGVFERVCKGFCCGSICVFVNVSVHDCVDGLKSE